MYNSEFIERLLNLASKIIGCISISAFASLIGIPIGIKTFLIELKIYAITAGIKKYKSIIKKKKKVHDKIVYLAIYKSNKMEVLIPEALIYSDFSHDELFLVNNVLK